MNSGSCYFFSFILKVFRSRKTLYWFYCLFFPPFLSGRYLGDDWMDLLEIFRLDVLVHVRFKISLLISKYGRYSATNFSKGR